MSKVSLGVISVLSYLSKDEIGCPFWFDLLPWICYYFHITFAEIYVFLKGTARYDYQSTYCKELAKLSAD